MPIHVKGLWGGSLVADTSSELTVNSYRDVRIELAQHGLIPPLHYEFKINFEFARDGSQLRSSLPCNYMEGIFQAETPPLLIQNQF